MVEKTKAHKALVHWFIHLLVHGFIVSAVGSLVHWFIRLWVHWFNGSLSVHRWIIVCSLFIGSLVHWFTGSSVQRSVVSSPLVHPFEISAWFSGVRIHDCMLSACFLLCFIALHLGVSFLSLSFTLRLEGVEVGSLGRWSIGLWLKSN